MSRISLQFEWEPVGDVELAGGVPHLPAAPSGPGVYSFVVEHDDASRRYIGEAQRLPERFATYQAAVRESGGTNRKMYDRFLRILEAGGTIRAFVASRLVIDLDGRPVALDLSNKMTRVFVEHAAVEHALQSGEGIINGRGYGPHTDNVILQ